MDSSTRKIKLEHESDQFSVRMIRVDSSSQTKVFVESGSSDRVGSM